MSPWGLTPGFPGLSPARGQVAHVLLTRPPRSTPEGVPVRLACIRHAASVVPEPGSNSPSSPAPQGARIASVCRPRSPMTPPWCLHQHRASPPADGRVPSGFAHVPLGLRRAVLALDHAPVVKVLQRAPPRRATGLVPVRSPRIASISVACRVVTVKTAGPRRPLPVSRVRPAALPAPMHSVAPFSRASVTIAQSAGSVQPDRRTGRVASLAPLDGLIDTRPHRIISPQGGDAVTVRAKGAPSR